MAKALSGIDALPAFVLVHGGFSGGWCWDRVSRQLSGAGYRVFTPTLTGLGDRAHLASPDVNLSTHIADIAAVIREHDLQGIILCGHSYGGMVISGVANVLASRIRSMVYLDAIVPEPGACLWDYLPDDQRRHFERLTEGISIVSSRPGRAFISPENADWVAENTTPHPRATLHECLPGGYSLTGFDRNIFVRATGYPSTMLDGSRERAAAMGWACLSLPFSHNLMIDAPNDVCEILMSAAM